MRNGFYNDFDRERVREGPLPEGDTRTAFETDRDRIIHSSAFRRLQSKTQVFLSGEYDFYRTRLTHSIEVAQIGRSLCRHLQRTSDLLGEDFFIDPDLVEGICLSHDLGHPPFGHMGERALNRLMEAEGGFEGNAQTLRLVTETLYQGSRGMNPTRAFLDGVLKYKSLHGELLRATGEAPKNHFLYDQQAAVLAFVHGGRDFPENAPPGDRRDAMHSIECAIMDWADDTAYSIHDIVDGIHAGFLDIMGIERWAESRPLSPVEAAHIEYLLLAIREDKVEPRMERKIGGFIQAAAVREDPGFLSDCSMRHRYHLVIEPEALTECRLYKQMALDQVFLSQQLKQLEYKGERMLSEMFGIFAAEYLDRETPRYGLLPRKVDARVCGTCDTSQRARWLCDYVAGMTDGFATRTYKRLTDPDFGGIADLV